MHLAIGGKALPSARERLGQIAFVERDDRRDFCSLTGDQSSRELAFRELWLSSDQDQRLIKIGSKHFAADFVLPVEQIAPLIDALNGAFVFAGEPLHSIAHNGLRFLASRVADGSPTIGRLHQAMPAEAGDHQTEFKVLRRFQRGLQCGIQRALTSASTSAAHSISVIEMPLTSCVLKRTMQRLKCTLISG